MLSSRLGMRDMVARGALSSDAIPAMTAI